MQEMEAGANTLLGNVSQMASRLHELNDDPPRGLPQDRPLPAGSTPTAGSPIVQGSPTTEQPLLMSAPRATLQETTSFCGVPRPSAAPVRAGGSGQGVAAARQGEAELQPRPLEYGDRGDQEGAVDPSSRRSRAG